VEGNAHTEIVYLFESTADIIVQRVQLAWRRRDLSCSLLNTFQQAVRVNRLLCLGALAPALLLILDNSCSRFGCGVVFAVLSLCLPHVFEVAGTFKHMPVEGKRSKNMHRQKGTTSSTRGVQVLHSNNSLCLCRYLQHRKNTVTLRRNKRRQVDWALGQVGWREGKRELIVSLDAASRRA